MVVGGAPFFVEARARLDRLLEILDELAEANLSRPIVVEGPRDVAALRDLGCRGVIEVFQHGAPLRPFVERLCVSSPAPILLPDWDPKGLRHLELLVQLCAANGARPDTSFHRRIPHATSLPLAHVESLTQYVARGLWRHYRQALEDRFER